MTTKTDVYDYSRGENKSITVEFLPMTKEEATDSLMLALDPDKGKDIILRLVKKVINPLKHDYDYELTPLQNWIKYLSILNGLMYTIPCDIRLADAIISCPDANRFMFIIS